MNASITIDIVLLDAATQIVSAQFDDKGEVVGMIPSDELEKAYADAEGKSVLRALCQCNGKQVGFVSHWFPWSDQCERDAAFRSMFRMIGESISIHQPWSS